MKRIAASVTGRVQGVFFRDSTQDRAVERGLTGWVRNETDGSVSVEAQGPDAAVDALVAWLRLGPPAARVVAVRVASVDPVEHESRFEIV